MQLLDCVFGKTDMEFYHYSQQCLSSLCCDKTILMMIPISLWNLPCWLLHEITGNNLFIKFGAVIWMKIGYLLCVFLMARECSKIIKKVKPDADHLLVYPLILGSFDILDSTMYACQDEIVYLLMLVITLRRLIEGNTKLFLVFATITVTLNPEMIIPVALMVVFREKRILRALIGIVITYVPSGLFSLIYSSNDVYAGFNWIDRAGGMMRELFTTDIGFSQKDGNVSLFLVVLCILLFYTYTKRIEDSDHVDIIWIMGVTMTSMTLLSSGSFMNYFYRSFLYVPFLVLVILTAKANFHTNLILFMLYTWSRGWLDVLNCPIQNISSNYLAINTEFTRRVFDNSRIVTPGRYIGREIPFLCNFGVFSAVCLALAVVIFYINYKKNQDKIFSTFKPKKDILVLATGLFVPAVIGLFGYSMIKSYKYDKVIQFGSVHAPELYEEAVGFDYQYNSGIFTFAHDIVYEDGLCLMNGEDKDGDRLLYEGGSSFGPYAKIPGGGIL